ncbi:hypothetical protein ACP70R_000574 [Stipagrostis hirtigluma subsp. patula]
MRRNGGGEFLRSTDDIFPDILHRLPPSTCRRLRLVCKVWRDGIDEHTEQQVRTKILTFIVPVNSGGDGRALVFDGKDGRRTHSWTYPCSKDKQIRMVGTCNGLLCLHESRFGGGGGPSTITVTNPITGEKMVLPPVPESPEPEPVRAKRKYSFAYHPTTGLYKVVHIPWRDCRAAHAAVQVFTLGGASWRTVPVLAAPGASYDRSCEAVSVDGWTYWLAAFSDDHRVMALDLKDERVTAFDVPAAAQLLATSEWQLTNVHARLGLVVTTHERVEVWMLEGGGVQPRWRWIVDTRWWYWITAPQLTYGRYILSAPLDARSLQEDQWKVRWRVYRHKVDDLADGDGKNERLRRLMGKELITGEDGFNGAVFTFAYVETLEPLPSNIFMDDNGVPKPPESVSRRSSS